ncbi:MAG TPA: hypothetical protein VFL36_06605 [Myxococcales bacterium]|nr:hypothetical protein [Myxococcales bacterium]
MTRTLPLALLALLLCSGARGEALDAVLARTVAVYGGEKALDRVRVVRQTGTLESLRGVAQTVRVFAPPARLRVEIRYPDGGGEVRVLEGARAWRNGEAVHGPPGDGMRLQAARLDLPRLLVRNRARLIDLGEIRPDGKALRGIGLAVGDHLQLVAGVDPKTGLILHSEGQLPSPGGPVRFATVYRDFRRVHGVLFAFEEANFASGQQTGVTRLKKIELLAAPPAGAFAP